MYGVITEHSLVSVNTVTVYTVRLICCGLKPLKLLVSSGSGVWCQEYFGEIVNRVVSVVRSKVEW